MADRRTFWPVSLTGGCTSALAAVAAARPWASAPNAADDAAKGADVAPLVLALALVGLAAWGAVLVTRVRGRRAVSGLGLLASVGAAAAVLWSREAALDAAEAASLGPGSGVSATVTGWFYVAAVASALSGVLFLLAVRWAPSWPEMSARYDTPGGKGNEPDDADLWKALDEGHDPTA